MKVGRGNCFRTKQSGDGDFFLFDSTKNCHADKLHNNMLNYSKHRRHETFPSETGEQLIVAQFTVPRVNYILSPRPGPYLPVSPVQQGSYQVQGV
jgi:hypothetical protein